MIDANKVSSQRNMKVKEKPNFDHTRREYNLHNFSRNN